MNKSQHPMNRARGTSTPSYLQLALTIVIILLAGCTESPKEEVLNRALSNQELEGYQRALAPRSFEFPRDHAIHPAFKNEWWYFTGNLATPDGRRFGYQVTFFRIALAPESEYQQRTSHWATNQIWMAHVAVTDIEGNQHHRSERFARGAAGLAGNETAPFRVWLDDWSLEAKGSEFPWHLKLEEQAFSLDLQVTPSKKIVYQGDRGLSQKSPEPGNASFYYSITRLKTTGQITIDGESFRVTGDSWLDREWGTSLLAEDQSGWDWFSLQLQSGEDLMYYQLRTKNQTAHANSAGSWVTPAGNKIPIKPQDMTLTPLAWWEDPAGARYPIRWQLDYKPRQVSWIVEAAIPDQLMDLTVKYWEGAVRVLDASTRDELGRGYLEMTGY